MADSESFERTPDKIQSHTHVPDEYEAGYRARELGLTEYKTATRSWRAGWQDADHEAIRSGLSLHVATQNDGAPAQWSLYGTGRQARACELPFDVDRGDAWKRSWVQADILLGLVERNRRS